jgi:pilus assembly protein Flp/PilA
MNWLYCLVQDKRGATAAEYALILAIVGGAVSAAAFFMGGAIAAAMNDAASCIGTHGGSCP